MSTSMPNHEQLNAIDELAQQLGVDWKQVQPSHPSFLPEGWLSLKVAGTYYTCSPSGESS